MFLPVIYLLKLRRISVLETLEEVEERNEMKGVLLRRIQN
jgi:hypothetical protein